MQEQEKDINAIDVMKQEINPFITNNHKSKIKLNVIASSFPFNPENLKDCLNFIGDRVDLNFSVKESLDDEVSSEILLAGDLEKFRNDLRALVEMASKVLWIETKNKKPIFIMFISSTDIIAVDKAILFSDENKDLADAIDVLFLTGYSKLEIST